MAVAADAPPSHTGPFVSATDFWLFGYGSLIWRPDLPYQERVEARLEGWARRFWQGSHDHRGVPEAPGRVVTLIEAPGSACEGIAYRVAGAMAPSVLAALDHREKNGYSRHRVRLRARTGSTLEALLYVAEPDNFAWLGPAPLEDIAAQIAAANGPSGSNRDYLLRLAAALRELGSHDDHVFSLESLLPRPR